MAREIFINNGVESNVNLFRGRLIGEGTFGRVYEARIIQDGHPHRVAIKQFKSGSEHLARHSVEHYQDAKAAGLKVFPDYQLDKNGGRILMTIGDDENTILLSKMPTDEKKRELGGNLIERIDNFDQLINDLKEECRKATKNKFSLCDDAFFFLVNRETKTQVDFIVGDFDMAWKEDRPDLEQWNLSKAAIALEKFIEYWVSPEVRQTYLAKIIYNKYTPTL